MDISAYGITSADNEGLYIIVDNDYSEVRDNLDPRKGIGAMKVTAVHEFFHIVQAEYDQWPTSDDKNMWWEENTAVWIEDELYDEVNDYLNYLGWPYLDDNDNGRWDDSNWYDIYGQLRSGERDQGWSDYPDYPLNYTGQIYSLYFE